MMEQSVPVQVRLYDQKSSQMVKYVFHELITMSCRNAIVLRFPLTKRKAEVQD